MSSILKVEGIEKTGVSTIIRSAAQIRLTDDPACWLVYADARNKTSHLYKESVAEEVAATARCDFRESVQSLIRKAEASLT